MKKHSHVIIGIHVTDRMKHAGAVQQVLTRYGAHIATRLGVHDVSGLSSSPNGIILLEMVGGERKCLPILKDLAKIEGIEAKPMVFRHD